MHFHSVGVCTACRKRRTYTTPMADELVLSSFCGWCMRVTMIGRNPENDCQQCWTLRRAGEVIDRRTERTAE